MNNIIDIPHCPVCSYEMHPEKAGDITVKCASCEVLYHPHCFAANGKCGIMLD